MRPGLTTSAAALALAGCLATAACGKGSSNALSGLTPTQAMQNASAKITSQSFLFDINAAIKIDPTQLSSTTVLPPSLRSPVTITLNGTGKEQSPQRASLTITLAPLVTKTFTLVIYDGEAYAALDGTHYSDAGTVNSVTGGFGITPGSVNTYLSNLGSVQDAGSQSIDGVTAEHYHVTLDASFLSKVFASGAGTAGATPNPLASIITQLISLRSGSVDAFVNQADGTLDRVTVVFDLGFDLGKLGALFGAAAGSAKNSLPSGTLGLSVNVQIHAHDYGTSVTVTKPAVDPTAPKLPGGGLGGLLGLGG